MKFILSIIFAFVAIAVSSAQNQEPCPVFCPLNYLPVCYRNSVTGEVELFSNQCSADVAICQNPQIKYRSRKCPVEPTTKPTRPPRTIPTRPPCPTFCTREFRPVCYRVNGVVEQFSNQCQADVAICQNPLKRYVSVRCPTTRPTRPPRTIPTRPPCRPFCTREFRPVCYRVNGTVQQFSNQCLADFAICQNPKTKYVSVRCPTTKPTRPPRTIPTKPPCPTFCTFEYLPVCYVVNGTVQQYSNQCAADIAMCENPKTKFVKAKCPSDELTLPPCPEICPAIYRPVCYRNLSTNEIVLFSNSCVAGVEFCKNPQTGYEEVQCADEFLASS